MKLCKDCFYCDKPDPAYPMSWRCCKTTVNMGISPLTGTPRFKYCHDERVIGECGPDGLFFSEKESKFRGTLDDYFASLEENDDD